MCLWALSLAALVLRLLLSNGLLNIDLLKPNILFIAVLLTMLLLDKKNVKIAFEVTGKAAKEMFDAMGPDKKDACSSEDQTRFRSRDGDKISCLLSNKGEYSCSFGFDLRSGKSIGGSIC